MRGLVSRPVRRHCFKTTTIGEVPVQREAGRGISCPAIFTSQPKKDRYGIITRAGLKCRTLSLSKGASKLFVYSPGTTVTGAAGPISGSGNRNGALFGSSITSILGVIWLMYW